MMFWSFLLHAVPIILVWNSINTIVTPSFSTNETDRLALLAFKSKINDDPLGALSSWNESIHYCQWNGVTCGRRHRDRITMLDLSYQKIEGTLSPYIGNLSFLGIILLTENRFHGPIPPQIGSLLRLKVLWLNNNSFVGEIPANLTHCSKLRKINLIDNHLSGQIPIALASLSELTQLGLGDNNLKGSIPAALGNLSSLLGLYLSENSLTGSIPDSLCCMRSMKYFRVGINNLTGLVPSCLYNLSHITDFAVSGNQLEGILPQDMGFTLPNLQVIYMGSNKFKGPIPVSLANASKLEEISMYENQLTGQVPMDLGKLKGLRILQLFENQLRSPPGDELNFITSLTNCSNFEELNVGDNFLNGVMPNSLVNLSTQLTTLDLRNNQMYGSIPVGFENLVNLSYLVLDDNHLAGEIPEAIGMFLKMQTMSLSRNEFSGRIPDSFHNSTLLSLFDFSENELHGTIPLTLSNCQQLQFLYLSDNKLNGTIPKGIGISSNIIELVLFNNALSGTLPFELGNLSSLVMLVVWGNMLFGPIPETLGNCLNLQYLDMAKNLFGGKIPQSLITLQGIKVLDISHNKLSGEIPKYLGNFTDLTYLNLSYNEFEGPVPTDGIFSNASAISIVGNRNLCGGVVRLKLPSCPIQTFNKRRSLKLKVIVPLIVVSLSLVLLSCFLFMLDRKRKSNKNPSPPSLLNHNYPRVSYAELVKATDNFSSDNLIGVGSHGSVYKGFLEKIDSVVAVKLYNLQQQGASNSFLSECNALRSLRHRNILKIITSCSSVDFQGNDFKALVFEYMTNGSLEEWLHPNVDEQQDRRSLSFLQRLNISIGVACALDYLHHHCQPSVVHCDLKPSNILLNEDMTAHLADFGLANILSSTSHNSSQSRGNSLAVKGSIGYVAPEYGMGTKVSMQGDVYSYGILLLEMFTGKRPTDANFQDGENLHNYAKLTLPEHVMEILDPLMFSEGSDEGINIANQSDGGSIMHESVVSVIQLGVACSVDLATERMNMGEVIIELYHIIDHFQGFKPNKSD